MQSVDEWAERIAREAVPEEVGQAPAVAHALIEGGLPRRKTTRSLFGPDSAMVFQHILTAINYAAPELRHFLGGLNTTTAEQLIGSAYFFFGAVSFRQSIRDRKEQAKSKASTDESAPAATPPPDFQVEGLKRVHQSLKAAFPSDARIGEEEKDRIIGRTLAAMLEDPPGAAEFVREIEKAS